MDSTMPKNMGTAQLSALSWLEPCIIVGTMIASLYFNRRIYSSSHRDYRSDHQRTSEDSGDTLLDKEQEDDNAPESSNHASRWQRPKPYAIVAFNRILQKFPFLVEMFYWILNYVAYRLSKSGAAVLWGKAKGDAVAQLAQDHGIRLLEIEQESFLKPVFFVSEVNVQRFLLQNHTGVMTILNQIYSLVHIPGTVAYVSILDDTRSLC